MSELDKSVEILVNSVGDILNDCQPSFMLHGSVVLNDFRFGWSDIDFICLYKGEIGATKAKELLNLRQNLIKFYVDNKYFRLFEGVFINEDCVFSESNIVYWGTSGQKIINHFYFDAFLRLGLIDHGKLILGNDFRHLLVKPSKDEICLDVRRHYQTIKDFGGSSGVSTYTAGWMLDIARCLYTLKYNKIISKTAAGEWALANNLCPRIDQMKNVIRLRKSPSLIENMSKFLLGLNESVQNFAKILDDELSLLGY